VIATAPGLSATLLSIIGCADFDPAPGSHPMATCAHDLGQQQTPRMSQGAPCEAEERTPNALTGRQRLALSLSKAGMSHAEIADRMGLKHRVTATKLIRRARKAEKAFVEAFADFIGNP
jgi:DNA-directed RNA polymerase specialized sigma24 family protein